MFRKEPFVDTETHIHSDYNNASVFKPELGIAR